MLVGRQDKWMCNLLHQAYDYTLIVYSYNLNHFPKKLVVVGNNFLEVFASTIVFLHSAVDENENWTVVIHWNNDLHQWQSKLDSKARENFSTIASGQTRLIRGSRLLLRVFSHTCSRYFRSARRFCMDFISQLTNSFPNFSFYSIRNQFESECEGMFSCVGP